MSGPGGDETAGTDPGRAGADSAAADLVVVGAGPVGLAVALGVARRGRSVLVLEKEPGTSEHSRAPVIWPRTQEVLESLGVLPRFLEEGIVLPSLELRDADRERTLLRLPLEELAGETPFPHLLLLPQSRTERLLHQALVGETEARVLFSAEVTGVEQEGSRVRVSWVRSGRSGGADDAAERGATDAAKPGADDAAAPRGVEDAPLGSVAGTVEAAFVAGCDGASSTLRKAIGADFEGTTYGLKVALADVEPDAGRDLPFPRFTTREGLAIAIRIDRDLWRLILPFAEEEETSLDERVERAVHHTLGPVAYETIWKSEFRIHRRVASRWLSGRVVLAGDAAHLNSPVGGQGMNAGLQDAEELAASLLAALERDDPAPLGAYVRRRRAAVTEGVNPFTGALTRVLLFGGGRLAKPVFRIAQLALRIGPLRRTLLRRLAMLP